MKVHKLDLEDSYDKEYSLIAIHTALEDYKLAYLLNQQLKTSFKKANFNLEFQNKKNSISFSVYEYANKEFDFNWFLISNSIKQEVTISNSLPLFTETKKYLIPEKKKVDFFIKIHADINLELVTETIQRIKEVNQVITSYQIDKNTLKSKDFLIF